MTFDITFTQICPDLIRISLYYLNKATIGDINIYNIYASIINNIFTFSIHNQIELTNEIINFILENNYASLIRVEKSSEFENFIYIFKLNPSILLELI